MFKSFREEIGYIHYCVPAHKYGEEDAWQGQVNEIEGHIKRSEHRITEAIKNQNRKENSLLDESHQSNSGILKAQN